MRLRRGLGKQASTHTHTLTRDEWVENGEVELNARDRTTDRQSEVGAWRAAVHGARCRKGEEEEREGSGHRERTV